MEISNDWVSQLYHRYLHIFLSTARNALGDQALAEDVVQDAFTVLLLNQDTVRKMKRPDIWLFKVLLGRINNTARRELMRRHLSFDDVPEVGMEDRYHFPLAGLLPAQLKPEERDILILYFDEQLSHAQIAERLRCSLTTCRTRLCRAKKHCRDLLLQEDL